MADTKQSWLEQIMGTNRAAMAPVLQTKSTSFPDQSLPQEYTTDYYAGNQVSVWLGDLWLDDLTMIQFQASQNKKPFYGYKSQRWNTVARGTQMVDGVFAMNYTHTNYLNMAVAYYLNKDISQRGMSDSTMDITEVQQFIRDLKNNPGLRSGLSYDYNVDNAVVPIAGPTTLNSLTAEKINNLSFDDKAYMLEQAIWGASDNQAAANTLQPDNLPGFDIVISYGNYPTDRKSGTPDESISAHTVRVISDVRILSHSMQSYITGEPQQEIYTFIARGVDMPVTRQVWQYDSTQQ